MRLAVVRIAYAALPIAVNKVIAFWTMSYVVIGLPRVGSGCPA